MIAKEFEIPSDVTFELSGRNIVARGPKGEVKKFLESTKDIRIEKLDGKIKVSSELEDRKTKAQVGTIIAHVRNAVNGVTKGYTYKMRVVYSHFPMTVKVEGDNVFISNFLGERVPRIARMLGDTEVKIDKQDLTITGPNLEEVSQTAANIEQACRIVGYDKKIFQDGIYLTSRE